MTTMRLFNLTDVETPELLQRGLVNQTLAIYDTLLGPGESIEVEETDISLRDANHYASLGALAIGELPSAYVILKSKEDTSPMASKVFRRKKDKW